MASGSEWATAGGARSPEELETLLEDASLMTDTEAMIVLFEPDALVLAPGGRIVRGHTAIAGAGKALAPAGYFADPSSVLQAGNLALVLSAQAASVMRRSRSGSWRFVICCLDP